MPVVAVLRLADGEVRAWVGDPATPGRILAEERRGVPPLVAGSLEEWETACRQALRAAVQGAGLPDVDYLGLVVSAAPEAVVLLGARDVPVGVVPVGSGGTALLRTLQEADPARWETVAHVVLPTDWLTSRLTGRAVAELSGACAVGMADLTSATWSPDLRADPAVGQRLSAPLVRPGTLVGELLQGWPLPASLPVAVACTPVQLAALGAGGRCDGVVAVVLTGSDGAVVVSTAGVASGCARESHEIAIQEVDLTDLVAELRSGLGAGGEVVVCGGGIMAATELAGRLATALGQDVHITSTGHAAATAGVALGARAVGAHAHLPGLPILVCSP